MLESTAQIKTEANILSGNRIKAECVLEALCIISEYICSPEESSSVVVDKLQVKSLTIGDAAIDIESYFRSIIASVKDGS